MCILPIIIYRIPTCIIIFALFYQCLLGTGRRQRSPQNYHQYTTMYLPMYLPTYIIHTRIILINYNVTLLRWAHVCQIERCCIYVFWNGVIMRFRIIKHTKIYYSRLGSEKLFKNYLVRIRRRRWIVTDFVCHIILL
jgi:hypothetical protein